MRLRKALTFEGDSEELRHLSRTHTLDKYTMMGFRQGAT